MANFTFEDLLTYSPFDALLIAFNETHGSALNPRFVALDKVVSSAGELLTVRVKAIPYSENMGRQPFKGQADINVKRFDIGEFFPSGHVIKDLEKMSSHDVARVIGDSTGIVFDPSDVVSEVITPENNILKASENSLRWFGQMKIHNS